MRLGVGSYQIGLDAPAPPDDNCIVNITLNTAFSTPINIVAQVAGGSVFVTIITPTTIPTGTADARFYITVVDDRF